MTTQESNKMIAEFMYGVPQPYEFNKGLSPVDAYILTNWDGLTSSNTPELELFVSFTETFIAHPELISVVAKAAEAAYEDIENSKAVNN